MRVDLDNTTDHCGDTIRKIVRRVYKVLRGVEGPHHGIEREGVICEVRYTRTPASDRVTGYAYVNSNLFRVRLPRGPVSTRHVADVVHHELCHCYGYRHKQMGGRYGGKLTDEGREKVLDGLPATMEIKPPCVAERAAFRGDVVVDRYRRICARVDKWQRELERAERLLAKAQAKKGAYEKRYRGTGRLTGGEP